MRSQTLRPCLRPRLNPGLSSDTKLVAQIIDQPAQPGLSSDTKLIAQIIDQPAQIGQLPGQFSNLLFKSFNPRRFRGVHRDRQRFGPGHSRGNFD